MGGKADPFPVLTGQNVSQKLCCPSLYIPLHILGQRSESRLDMAYQSWKAML